MECTHIGTCRNATNSSLENWRKSKFVKVEADTFIPKRTPGQDADFTNLMNGAFKEKPGIQSADMYNPACKEAPLCVSGKKKKKNDCWN